MNSEILIAKLFIKTAFKNKAVFILTLFIGLLLIFAAFTGWTNFKNQNEMKAKYQEQSRKDWVNNPDKHPHRMAHYGNFAFRPKAPLSVLISVWRVFSVIPFTWKPTNKTPPISQKRAFQRDYCVLEKSVLP